MVSAAYTRDEAANRLLANSLEITEAIAREWASLGIDRKMWSFSVSLDSAQRQPDGSYSITDPPTIVEMLKEIVADTTATVTAALFETIWSDAPEEAGPSGLDAENHRLRLENRRLRAELASSEEIRQRVVQIDLRPERIAGFFDQEPGQEQAGGRQD